MTQARPAQARSRIGRRISALVAIAVLTSVILVTGAFIWTQTEDNIQERRKAIEATAYVFASAIADHVALGNRQEAFKVLRSISRVPDITYAAVTGPDNREIASLGNSVFLQDNLADTNPGFSELLTRGSFPVAVDIIKGGALVGRLVVIADISGLRAQLAAALLTALITAAAASILGMAIAGTLQRRITGPILALTRAMAVVRDRRDYSAKVEHQSDDETGVMVETFNGMIAEINSRDEALERHRQGLEATVEMRTRELSVARDAAEAANHAKSGFLATMSHEIRTPMNGVMVMAELLAGAGLEQRHQRYAEVIVKSGQSLLTIINDILDLSKIEAGKLELEKVEIDPVSIGDDVVSLFWERASSKGLDLACCVEPGLPRRIAGDPVRLNQIVANLTNNALKFTESGEVLIRLRFDGRTLHLSVRDSGIGIAPEKLAGLFEAFTQADQSTTRKYGGTGLGLTISKRLAEAMGGTISVTSEAGKGSNFTVSIPVEVMEPARPGTVEKPLRIGIALTGHATAASLRAYFAARGHSLANPAPGLPFDVVFAAAADLASYASVTPRPKLVCVAGLGDSAGENAIAAGRADDLILLPLRHSDIEEMEARMVTGKFRGRSLLNRRSAPKPPGRSFAGRRILVADDNAVNREVIIEVLRQLDAQVETAGDGHEALALWRRSRPDLVFMDCSMPGMDGFAATRAIRAEEPAGSHTPIVALTAHVAGGANDTWREAGMDAYLTKPFTMRTIIDCLDGRLAGAAVAPAGPHTAVPVIDSSVIDELRSIGGSDALLRRVLSLFVEAVPHAMDTIEHHDDAGLKALADAVHALKSMCANIGARRAQMACDELELVARTGQNFDAGAKVGNIAREIEAALAEVKKIRAA